MAAEPNEPITIPAQLDKEWKADLGARLDKQDDLLQSLTARMETQETAFEGFKGDLKTLLEFFSNMVGAFKVFNYLGKLAKPLGYIFGAITAIGVWWLTFWGKK